MRILLFTTILLLSGCAQRYREDSDTRYSDHPLANRYQIHTYPLQIENVSESLPVTFKLDSVSGQVWRLEGDSFVQITVEGKRSAYDMDKSSEEIETERRKAELIEKMDSIIIPEIDFRQANIRDVIMFLQQSSIDFSQDQRGFSCILQLEPSLNENQANTEVDLFADIGDDTLITFSAMDISLREAFDIVCDVGGLSWDIRGHVISVRPRGCNCGVLITRTYKLRTSVFNFFSEMANNDKSISLSKHFKSYFEKRGVVWTASASVEVFPLHNGLVVTNTLENLKRIEDVLATISTFRLTTGRYRLLNSQDKKQDMVILLDSEIGHTWKYNISDYNGDAGLIQNDSFEYITTISDVQDRPVSVF